MNLLANSDALIVDVRRNGGGDPAMVALISSYLFDDVTHLNDLYFRPADSTRQWWTLPFVPGRKLAGKPVALPLAVLLGPIGDVRAHLYASFHSSRTKTERTGSASSLISRATLTDLSGVSPRTQQAYEKKAGVTVKRNLAPAHPPLSRPGTCFWAARGTRWK